MSFVFVTGKVAICASQNFGTLFASYTHKRSLLSLCANLGEFFLQLLSLQSTRHQQ